MPGRPPGGAQEPDRGPKLTPCPSHRFTLAASIGFSDEVSSLVWERPTDGLSALGITPEMLAVESEQGSRLMRSQVREQPPGLPDHAFTGHGPLVAASVDEGKSHPDCRVGDDAEADATRPQQALGTRGDGIEEGHWASLGRALPRHVRAKEARVHGRAFRAVQEHDHGTERPVLT
jgi:hypothetical protein